MSSLNVESSVEGERNEQQLDDQPSKKRIRWGLLLVYMTFTGVGAIGGPLLQRLYYVHGGSRKWFSSCLQTLGFPIIFIPLSVLCSRRRAQEEMLLKTNFIERKLIMASSILGVLLGIANYMYSVGLAYIPVSTSSLLFSTQLAFTAIFAFLIVKQKFTFYSVNSVVLMTLGAIVLALHTRGDRPPGVTKGQYMLGFFLTLGGAVLSGFIYPSIERSFRKASQAVTYTVVLQFQIISAFFATVFCLIGMAINNDFQAISREAEAYELGEVKYYMVLVSNAIAWQFLPIGSLGLIHCTSSLFSGIVGALLLPFTPVAAIIVFNEKFTGEKGLSLALCIWGFASYFVGEYKSMKMIPITEPKASDV